MGLLFLAGLLVVIGTLLYAKGSKAAAEVAEIIGGVLAVAALAPPLVRRWRQAGQYAAPTPDDLESAKQILAGLVEEQWRLEASIRSLDDPKPIPVVWQLTERDNLMDHPQHIASGTLHFSGKSDQIRGLADSFRQLRRRRLVVLGGPGAGKTTLAVQLVLELLSTRVEGEPIPVLFTVNNWDITAYPRLQDWLAIQLGQNYPALRGEKGEVSIPRALAVRAQVLPVLDGLDELPNAARAKVITALNRSLGDNDQLIITSRTSEFAAAVKAEENVLRSAAVIEPAALSPDTVTAYLKSCLPPQPKPPWLQILADIRKGRARALAEVTSTPLGIWLLRTVYITTRRSPTVLRREHLRDPSILRQHLFSELIPALISTRPPTNDPADIYRPRREWQPEDIRRWLGWYAWTLNEANAQIAPDKIRDFTWWRLAGYTLPPFMIGLFASIVGLFSGFLFGTAIRLATIGIKDGLIYALLVGSVLGLCQAGIAGTLAGTRWLYEAPGYADLRIRRRRSISKRDSKASAPLRRFRSPLGMALFVALVVGGVAAGRGPMTGLAVTIAAGFIVWLEAWLLKWAEAPAVTDGAITPMSSWRADRTLILLRISLTTLAFALALGLGSWLTVGGQKSWLVSVLTSLLAGASMGFFFGVIMGNHHAWLLFVIAKLRLVLLGHLFPFKLMPFLDDCHRLGLLRAVGSAYQYRHAELQDYLAASFSRRYAYIDRRPVT